MMQLLKIYAKQLLPHSLIILLIVVGQLAISRMNQLFVNSTIPPTALEVYVAKESKLTDTLLNKLEKVPEISLKKVSSLDESDLKTKDIQGILVIPKNFDEALKADQHKIVKVLIANGIQDTTAINEAVSTNLIQMKSELLLDDSLTKNHISLTKDEQTDLADDLLLEVQYVNGQSRRSLGSNRLSIGIITLFILVAVLYGSSFLPSLDSRRLRMYAPVSLVKNQSAAMMDLLLLWSLEIGLFLVGVKFLLKTTLPTEDILLLFGVLVYALSFSLLLVNIGLRELVSFLFVPWLILNMTLGGGLWNVPTTLSWLHPLLPVAMALNHELVMLLSCTGIFLAASGIILWWKSTKRLGAI